MGIGVGIIGVGRAGGELHMPQLAKLDAYDIIGVYDVSAERAKQRTAEFGGEVFPSYEAMLGDRRVELVVVATPSNSHAEYSIQALEAGKHVVVDKPPATSLDEGKRMFKTAERCGRVLITYQNRRWDGDFLAVRDIIKSGLIGDVWLIENRVQGSGDRPWGEFGLYDVVWRHEKAYGGGYLLDWGPHLIDQTLLLAGAPVQSVFADVRGGIWSKDADDHFMLVIRFANGVFADCVGSAAARYEGYRWHVVGTNGALMLEDWGKTIRVKHRKAGKNTETTFEAHKTEWEQFYVALAKTLAGKADPAVKPEDSLRLLRVIEAARESARTGQSVPVES